MRLCAYANQNESYQQAPDHQLLQNSRLHTWEVELTM